jgi:hypothetical protein
MTHNLRQRKEEEGEPKSLTSGMSFIRHNDDEDWRVDV